jgi:hypothetical protein
LQAAYHLFNNQSPQAMSNEYYGATFCRVFLPVFLDIFKKI